MAHVDLVEGITHPLGYEATVVRTAWNEKPLIQKVPGARRDVKHEVWLVPRSWASHVQLRGLFPEATYGDAYRAWAQHEFETRVAPSRALREALTFNGLTYDERLRAFQNAWLPWASIAQYGILGDEMGLGKTIELLSFLRFMVDSLPALIVCPNAVKEHWAERVPVWLPRGVPYVVEGSAANRTKVIANARADENAVVIINIEATRLFSRLAPYGSVKLQRCRECDTKFGDPELTPSRCHVHPKPLNGFGFKSVIVDEIHRIKEPKSQQTRALWALAHDPSVRYRWGSTGTLIANNPMDAWSPLHTVAPEEYPVRSSFAERYALESYNAFGGTDVVGLKPSTRDEFFAFFDARYRRMLKAVVLPQLPPKVYTTRYVDLTRGQRRMYDQLHESMETRDDNGEIIVTPDLLVTRTRKMQLSSASLVVIDKLDEDDPTTWKMVMAEPSSVLDELEAVLEENGDAPCVVAAQHKQLVMLASKRLTAKGIPHGLITGDVTPKLRQVALQNLRDRRIRTVLFTVAAGGTGVDMSMASKIIFIQRPDSMIDYKQAEDRVHRIGAEGFESIDVIHIVARGTVEQEKMDNLAIKLARLEELNRDRAQLARLGRPEYEMRALDEEIEKLNGAWLTASPTDQKE